MTLLRGGLFETAGFGYSGIAYYAGSAIEKWKAIYQAAKTTPIVIPLFGDSQETSPGGFGKAYVPALNYNLTKGLGGYTGIVYVKNFSSYGGGSPPAAYMLRGSNAGTDTSNLTGSYVPPNFVPMKMSKSSSVIGAVTLLQHDCINVSADAGIPSGLDLFGRGEPFYVDIWARQYSGSQEVSWQYSVQASNVATYGNTNISTGVTSGGLDNAANGIVKMTVGPLQNPTPTTTPYNCFEAGAAALNNGADVLALQFRRSTGAGGIHVISSGAAGYRVDHFLTNHGDCGPYLAQAMDQSGVVFLHFGANDIYGGYSAAAVRANYETLITALRGASFYNDADLLVVIFTETPRINGTTDKDTQADLLIDELYDLADNDHNVMIVNTRAMVEARGFTRETGAAFLVDNVHYNAAGAQLVAYVEAEALRLAGS